MIEIIITIFIVICAFGLVVFLASILGSIRDKQRKHDMGNRVREFKLPSHGSIPVICPICEREMREELDDDRGEMYTCQCGLSSGWSGGEDWRYLERKIRQAARRAFDDIWLDG